MATVADRIGISIMIGMGGGLRDCELSTRILIAVHEYGLDRRIRFGATRLGDES